MRASGGIDELSRDAHSVCRFAHAPFQHVAHSKLASDLLHVNGAPLVGEARVACDHEQLSEMRQRGNDLLHYSISEIVLLWIGAQIGEGENSDCRLIRKR